MKRKTIAPIFAAVLLLSNSITAFAAPEVINVGGVRTVFDAEYYASANPDVAAVIGTNRDALAQHYTAYGKAENRLAYAPGTDVNALLEKKKIKSKTVTKEGRLLEHEEYDKYGNFLLRTNVLGDTTAWSYTYDAQGNVLSETDSKGKTATYTYDAHGNLLSETHSEIYDFDETFIFTYTETYTYDAHDNLLSKTYSDGRTETYTYTYDAHGNILSKTSPGGKIETYTYDAQGNLLSATLPNGSYTYTYTYGAQGNLLSTTRSDGYIRTCDAYGNELSWISPDGETYTYIYTYDAYGNVLSKTSPAHDYYETYTETYTYTYDAHGNILSKTGPGTIETYTYDEYGNVLSKSSSDRYNGAPVETETYTYF